MIIFVYSSFAFFDALRPASYLRDAVQTWLKRPSVAGEAEMTISVHSRAFNAYKKPTPAGVPFATCKRLTTMTVEKAIAHINSANKCCAAKKMGEPYPEGIPPLARTTWAEGFSRFSSSGAASTSATASFGVFAAGMKKKPIGEALREYNEQQLLSACHLTPATFTRLADWLVGAATAKRAKVLIVSDHQWDEVDAFMRDEIHAASFAGKLFQDFFSCICMT